MHYVKHLTDATTKYKVPSQKNVSGTIWFLNMELQCKHKGNSVLQELKQQGKKMPLALTAIGNSFAVSIYYSNILIEHSQYQNLFWANRLNYQDFTVMEPCQDLD